MAKLVIVDSANTSRASMVHQMAQLNLGHCLQFKSFDDAFRGLKEIGLKEGVIIASVLNSVPTFLSFASKMRETYPNFCIIATSESISFEEMRLLIGAGIDQIIVKPCTVNQLKEKIAAGIKFRQQVLSEMTESSNAEKLPYEGTIEKISDSIFKVTLKGYISENCILPVEKAPSKEATLFSDLNLVRGINSIGVRSWVMWLKTLNDNGFSRIEFENLQPAVLQQASLVAGFIPPWAVVNSFFLNYWSEELETNKEFKYIRGKDFDDKEMKIPDTREEVVNGKKIHFEVEHHLDKILKFYSGKLIVL